jgi:hypothetical protein
MKTFLAAFLFSAGIFAVAQEPSAKLSFALPEHSGKLTLDAGDFKVSEFSAKPNGSEWGIRAENGELHFLGFLFAWPEKANLTAAACREEMLTSEGSESLAAAQDRSMMRSRNGVDIALVLMIPKTGNLSAIRAFVASGNLCGDLTFSMHQPITKQMVPMQKVKDILETVQFYPTAKPTFQDALLYATLEWNHHQLEGATYAYKAALRLVDTSDDPLKWRRVVTDQLSMALGMSGDLKQSRAVNEAAIQRDPVYPMYYYDLACADAEEGNAVAARAHLQQAFDRSGNVLAGESMPDPTSDNSILKLKDNKEFWAFVQTLQPKIKQ